METLLWPDDARKGESDAPTLTQFLPQNSGGASVLILLGGGYESLATDHEGTQIAAWLGARGIAAWMLKYRLGPRHHYPAQLHDAQRAMRLIRSRAQNLKLDTNRIGVWGLSAGGHLASTLITHFDDGDSNGDAVERTSCRPDFAVLCYPVITMRDDFTHAGSKRNLLGENPDAELVELLSSEAQVTEKTPPTFLFHTGDDEGVAVENSIQFYLALRRARVAAELHVYERGAHGVGLAQSDPILSSWPDRLEDWLRLHQWM